MDLSGLAAELAEIDENLMRNELHYLDRSDQLERRKVIYEELHPETRHGMKNGQTSKNEIISSLDAPTFAEDTAAKLGVSRRTVEQEIQIAKNLVPEAKAAVKKADMPKTEAVRLARMEPARLHK